MERPQRPRQGSVSIEALEALQRGDFETVERLMQNDFHDVIASAAPEICDGDRRAARRGRQRVLLAGSGSCVFALARDRATADAIASRVALPAPYELFVTRFAPTPEWVGEQNSLD